MTLSLFAPNPDAAPLVIAALHLPDFARNRHRSTAWLEDYALTNARVFAEAGVPWIKVQDQTRTDGPAAADTLALMAAITRVIRAEFPKLGLGIIITFDSAPTDWRGKWWMLPVIHAVIALPLAVRVIGPALRGIGTELLESAADLGAGPVRRWRSVQAPLLAPALARAAGISAAVSLGEFGATSFLTRGDTKTVPIVIGELMGRPGPLLQQSAFGLTTVIASAVTIASSLTSSQRTLTNPRRS